MALKSPSKHPAQSYIDTHWGEKPRRIVKVGKQAKMPYRTTEMGRLIEIRLRALGAVDFSKAAGRKNILAYDAPPRTRLYLQLTGPTKKWLKAKLVAPSGEWYPIKDVAKSVGGRQAKHEDRSVKVQALGRATHVLYMTKKRGDGFSTYIHKLGEGGGIEPMLCIDKAGQLYFVGGSNVVRNAGIDK